MPEGIFLKKYLLFFIILSIYVITFGSLTADKYLADINIALETTSVSTLSTVSIKDYLSKFNEHDNVKLILKTYKDLKNSWKVIDKGSDFYTIQNSLVSFNSKSGDTDDFSVLMAKLINESGGKSRITFANELDKNYAFAEFFIPNKYSTSNIMGFINEIFPDTPATDIEYERNHEGIWFNFDLKQKYPGEKNYNYYYSAVLYPYENYYIESYGNLNLRNLLFFDDFNDNSKNWLDKDYKDFSYHVTNNNYVIKSNKPDNEILRINKDISIDPYSDYELQTKIKGESSVNSGYGFLWDCIDINNFYYFMINNSGQYTFGKKENGKNSTIIPWKDFDFISKNNYNELRIRKKGFYLWFYINDELAEKTLFDPLYGKFCGFDIAGEITVQIDKITVFGYLPGIQ